MSSVLVATFCRAGAIRAIVVLERFTGGVSGSGPSIGAAHLCSTRTGLFATVFPADTVVPIFGSHCQHSD